MMKAYKYLDKGLPTVATQSFPMYTHVDA